jgi:hypothetical protein
MIKKESQGRKPLGEKNKKIRTYGLKGRKRRKSKISDL